MYWLASPCTWTSMSSSRWLPGRMTFLVITAAAGRASATLRMREPRALWARLIASPAASMFAIFPSTTVSLGSGSMEYRSTRYTLRPASAISTILTEDELMSQPTRGGAFAFRKSNWAANFSLSIVVG